MPLELTQHAVFEDERIVLDSLVRDECLRPSDKIIFVVFSFLSVFGCCWVVVRYRVIGGSLTLILGPMSQR